MARNSHVQAISQLTKTGFTIQWAACTAKKNSPMPLRKSSKCSCLKNLSKTWVRRAKTLPESMQVDSGEILLQFDHMTGSPAASGWNASSERELGWKWHWGTGPRELPGPGGSVSTWVFQLNTSESPEASLHSQSAKKTRIPKPRKFWQDHKEEHKGQCYAHCTRMPDLGQVGVADSSTWPGITWSNASITQGNNVHLVTSGNTTGTVKAAGDLVTTRGKAHKERDKKQWIEEDQDSDPWSSYYSLYTGTCWL